ncbi:MAG: hypothetical protein ACRDYD_14115 [Acidimicrobiales bacterium]
MGVTVSLDLGSWLPPEVAELLGEGAGAVLLVGERASGVLRPAAGGAARESAEAAQVGGADVLVQAVPGTGSMRVEVQGSSWLSSLVDRRLGDLSAALAGPSRPTPEPSWSPGATRPG